MQPITRNVAKYYGAWITVWVSVALYGKLFTYSGEYELGAWLWLSVSGMPLSLVTWNLSDNGSLVGIFLVSAAGLFQWCTIAELNAKFEAWKESRKRRS